MDKPERCMVPREKQKVCRLVKSLFGLKQEPKQWQRKFDHVLISNGFSTNDVDKCICSIVENNSCITICLYVDDMLIFGSNLQVFIKTKSFLISKFDMKNLGEVEVILEIKITKTLNGLNLCQAHYVKKILKRFEY